MTEMSPQSAGAKQNRRFVCLKGKQSLLITAGACLIASLCARFRIWQAGGTESAPAERVGPRVAARTPEEAGRYLVQVAGCNDCHTAGYVQPGGERILESDWLTGSPLGRRGPWGTTYASNLRLYVKDFSEDLWVKTMRERRVRPPMPWRSLHAMSDDDLRAIFRYIKLLGVKGEKMPEFVQPSAEPTTPYQLLTPQQPKG